MGSAPPDAAAVKSGATAAKSGAGRNGPELIALCGAERTEEVPEPPPAEPEVGEPGPAAATEDPSCYSTCQIVHGQICRRGGCRNLAIEAVLCLEEDWDIRLSRSAR